LRGFPVRPIFYIIEEKGCFEKMSFFHSSDSLAFNLNLHSPFDFICLKCCSCCYQRHIELNELEIARLSQFLEIPESELIKKFLIPGQKPSLRTKEDGSCIFLGQAGCQIHPARPLVCRLYPLGLLFGQDGEEKWGLMPTHPDCLGIFVQEKTLEEYLLSQGAIPYLQFERQLRNKGK
jgi:Fe-S-cluster containining protein